MLDLEKDTTINTYKDLVDLLREEVIETKKKLQIYIAAKLNGAYAERERLRRKAK